MGCDSTVIVGSQFPDSISIHAARVGCDVLNVEGLDTTIISIHAARVGCDSFDNI